MNALDHNQVSPFLVGMFTGGSPERIHEVKYLLVQLRENLGVNIALTVADTFQEYIERAL